MLCTVTIGNLFKHWVSKYIVAVYPTTGFKVLDNSVPHRLIGNFGT